MPCPSDGVKVNVHSPFSQLCLLCSVLRAVLFHLALSCLYSGPTAFTPATVCVSSAGESPWQQRLPYGNKTGCGLPLLHTSPPPHRQRVTPLHDITYLKVQSEHVCPQTIESVLGVL